MNCLYIFTAGTSLITNLSKKREWETYATGLSRLVENLAIEDLYVPSAEDSWKGTLGQTPDQPGALWALGHYGHLSKRSARESTAELATFLKLKLDSSDQAVLLASDTPAGVFCALVNAHLMAASAPDSHPVQVWDWEIPGHVAHELGWHTPHTEALRCQDLKDRARNWVGVQVIKGLDPVSPRGVQDTAVGELVFAVSRLVKYARNHSPVLEPVLVFTGGFKMSLPVLTQAAGWLGGLRMIDLHEDSDSLVEIPVLRTSIGPELEARVLGVAWRDQRRQDLLEQHYLPSKLDEWASLTAGSFNVQEERLQPLLKEANQAVQLNILGEAVLSVLLALRPETTWR
jgi:hypothetical protein